MSINETLRKIDGLKQKGEDISLNLLKELEELFVALTNDFQDGKLNAQEVLKVISEVAVGSEDQLKVLRAFNSFMDHNGQKIKPIKILLARKLLSLAKESMLYRPDNELDEAKKIFESIGYSEGIKEVDSLEEKMYHLYDKCDTILNKEINKD